MELEKENIKQTNVGEQNLKEITFGGSKYLHSSDDEYDYLFGSENGVKVTLKFSKDKERNEKAMEGIKTFFSWL